MTLQAGLSFDEFSATGAGIGLIRNCSAALVPVLADKMEQLFQCVVMPTYAMSESRFAHIALVFLCFSIYIYIYILKWHAVAQSSSPKACPSPRTRCHHICVFCAVLDKQQVPKWFSGTTTTQSPKKARQSGKPISTAFPCFAFFGPSPCDMDPEARKQRFV